MQRVMLESVYSLTLSKYNSFTTLKKNTKLKRQNILETINQDFQDQYRLLMKLLKN